jgi:hypothetical protein
MDETVNESRKGERFLAVVPIDGTFGTYDVQLLNMSIHGAQILHAQTIRIGTRAAFSFVHNGMKVVVQVQVVWSHLAQTGERLLYRSGLKLVEPDIHYASAIHDLLRAGRLTKDMESLDRKKQRELEREKRRQSGPKAILPTG